MPISQQPGATTGSSAGTWSTCSVAFYPTDTLARVTAARPDHVRPENTNEGLGYHTDGSDLLMLMCIRQAMIGGNSVVSSSARTVKEIARRYPELLPSLFEDYFPFDRQMEILEGDTTYYLSRRAGRLRTPDRHEALLIAEKWGMCAHVHPSPRLSPTR